MTDFHVHTGQWHEIYYEPEAVVTALTKGGTEEFYFSSTTSERYCKDSIAVKDKPDLQKELPTARELYDFIKNEISTALETAKKLGAKHGNQFSKKGCLKFQIYVNIKTWVGKN